MKRLLPLLLIVASCSTGTSDNTTSYTVAAEYLDKAGKTGDEAAIGTNMLQASKIISNMPQDSLKTALNSKYVATYMQLHQSHPQALVKEGIIMPVDTTGVN